MAEIQQYVSDTDDLTDIEAGGQPRHATPLQRGDAPKGGKKNLRTPPSSPLVSNKKKQRVGEATPTKGIPHFPQESLKVGSVVAMLNDCLGEEDILRADVRENYPFESFQFGATCYIGF
jgi:hypothetical protein